MLTGDLRESFRILIKVFLGLAPGLSIAKKQLDKA